MIPLNENSIYLKEMLDLFQFNLNSIHFENAGIWSNKGWLTDFRAPSSERFSFDIYFLIEGSAKLIVGGQPVSIESGDVLFVDNAVDNRCENGKFTIFGFNFCIDQNNGDRAVLDKKFRDCYHRLSGQIFTVHKYLLKSIYLEIVKENIAKPDEYQLNIKLLGLQILVKVLRESIQPNRMESQYRYFRYSSMVSEIILYISENMQRDIPLDELSERYGFSSRYLNRIFKGVTGYPILQYLQQLKVEKAKKLLKSSSLSILDIALDLNFGSSQYLSFIFKKITGYTPVEYRKMG